MAEPLSPSTEFWRIFYITLGRDRVILHLEPVRRRVKCPVCGTPTSRVHSRYGRRAWDLPWSRWPVQIRIQARRFFCDEPCCPRRIFTEPFSPVLGRYSRRIGRSQAALLELAHSSSAERAAQVARLLGFIVSADSLIRWQRQERFAIPAPLVLGVDEFALRRGKTYGTLLVDLLRRCPIDLMESKSAASLAAWLRQHPGVAVLARDRADAYAWGARMAVPGALQLIIIDGGPGLQAAVKALEKLADVEVR